MQKVRRSHRRERQEQELERVETKAKQKSKRKVKTNSTSPMPCFAWSSFFGDHSKIVFFFSHLGSTVYTLTLPLQCRHGEASATQLCPSLPLFIKVFYRIACNEKVAGNSACPTTKYSVARHSRQANRLVSSLA